MAQVTVDVDLDEFDDEDLLRELKIRGILSLEKVSDLIARLKKEGCPCEIIDQLNEWSRIKVTTIEDLKKWREWYDQNKEVGDKNHETA